MKRPLCICCTILLCVLMIYWHFIPPKSISVVDNQMLLLGTIIDKEEKHEEDKITTVVYIKTNQYILNYQQSNSNLSEQFNENKKEIGVICYIENLEIPLYIGQLVELSGEFVSTKKASNPGQFDFKNYYDCLGYQGFIFDPEILKVGISYNRIKEVLFLVKKHITETIASIYGEQDKGLIIGLMVGNTSEIEDHVMKLYQRNGIIHILAISGLHISILGVGCYELLRKCKINICCSTIISSLFMLIYGVFLGTSVSLVRAISMFLFRSIARIIGRTYDLYTALGMIGLSIICIEPRYLSYSGFWLSFGSVLGIAILAPIGNEIIQVNGKLEKIKQGLVASIAVTIMTLPILLYFYYEISTYAMLLNLLVVPLMSGTMGMTIINISIAYLIQGIDQFMSITLDISILDEAYFLCRCIGMIQHYIFLVIENVCYWVESFPKNLLIVGQPHKIQIFLYYLGLVGIIAVYYYPISKKNRKHEYRKKIGLIIGIFLLPMILKMKFHQEMSIHFLDIGQGDCTIIFFQEHTILIDGGSTSKKNVGEDIIIPFLKYYGRSHISAIFITHPDADHYNGITQLMELSKDEGIKIEKVYLPVIVENSIVENTGMNLIITSARNSDIPIAYVEKGSRFTMGEMTIECLNPPNINLGTDPNQYSIVQYITYGDFSLLTMGDADDRAEELVTEELKKMDIAKVSVLKVGHHGSAKGSNIEFLEITQPIYSIISCGEHNQYGHPNQGVVDRLQRIGANDYITYESGAISIYTTGKEMKLREFLE